MTSDNMRAALVLIGAFLIGSTGLGASQGIEWRTFAEPNSGTRLDIPSGIFSITEEPSESGFGHQFKTPDGRAVLRVYSRDVGRQSPERYLRENYAVPRASMDYVRVTRSFFAISAVNDGTIYYSRCNFSRHSHGSAAHCFDLKYPENEKRAWDAVVTRISRSLRSPSNGFR
jgi:hypothetical protein